MRRPVLLSRAAPALTLVLLCVLPAVFPNRTTADEAALTRQRAVARAVEHAPYRIGSWIGEDIQVPPAATRLLRPNAILSRRFRRIDDDLAVDLLLVHCTDARDMGGHYPPNCYPSSGWLELGGDAPRQATLEVSDRSVPVRVYAFRRVQDDAREVRIRVLNVFILPGGELTADIHRIKTLAGRRALTTAGVAQLQIVSSSDLDEARVAEAAGEILAGMPELLNALRPLNGDDHVQSRP
jgi:hypothetical protein